MPSLRKVFGLKEMIHEIKSIEQDVVMGKLAEHYLLIKFKRPVIIDHLLKINEKKNSLRRYKEFLLNVVHNDHIECNLFPDKVLEWSNGVSNKKSISILQNDDDYCLTSKMKS